jgi:hypothetical protein
MRESPARRTSRSGTACKIRNVVYGINTGSENSRGWYIADNVIEGINRDVVPAARGVHVTRSHGSECLRPGACRLLQPHHSLQRFAGDRQLWPARRRCPERHCVAIDFYSNDLSWAQDDTIEADYGCHNVRVYRNRCYNTHTALSTQPFYGGPVYLIRNEAYGITSLTFKLNNYPAGILGYNNTVCCARQGFQPPAIWQNGHFRNNLFMGGQGYAMETGSPTPYSTLDYNGYRRNSRRAISQMDRCGSQGRSLSIPIRTDAGPRALKSMASKSTTTSLSRRRRLEKPRPINHLTTICDSDAAPCIDAGVALPQVTDNFRGAGPDLGCYEFGQAVPHYGPRR